MGGEYLDLTFPLTGQESFILAQQDPTTKRWRPRRITLSDLRTMVGVSQAARDASQDAALAALAARVAALEGRPQEAAHFTVSAKLPAVAALASFTLTLTGLVPAVAGDSIAKGEFVLVEPAGALPAGLVVAAVYAPAPNTVAVQFQAGLSLGGSAAPVPFNITALR